MNIYRRYREYQKVRQCRRAERDAEDLFQIREHDGKLWLTFNHFLVCPCTMLGKMPVDAVGEMRRLYVERVCGKL